VTVPRPPRTIGIRAVTLDCWGTLFVDGPGADEGYARQRLAGMAGVLKGAGVPASPRELERAYGEMGRWLGRTWRTHRDVPVREHVVMLLERLDAALLPRLRPEVLEALVDAYARPAAVVPPALDPGAAPALAELAARGVALGVVSNVMRTPGRVLREVFAGYGVLSRFGALAFSDECGVRKPDPEIFRITLRELGVSPQDAVHVGDDALLDVEGARAARMRVVQVLAHGETAGAPQADAVIAGLEELPAALDRLVRPARPAATPPRRAPDRGSLGGILGRVSRSLRGDGCAG
jgi:HAD superfamily hydrolase (TIGR01509 family)